MRRKFNITKLKHFFGHKDAVYTFSLDKKRQRIFSAGADGYIVQWDLDKDDNGLLLLTASEAFYSVYFCASSNYLLAAGRSGTLYVVDLQNNDLIFNQKVSPSSIFTILEKDGLYYIGDEKGILFILDKNFNEVDQLRIGQHSIRCSAMNSEYLIFGCSDHKIYVLNNEKNLVQILEGHHNSVFAMEFLNPEILISTGRDAMLTLWDLKSGATILSVPAHMYQAKSISVGENGIILTSSMDKTIKLWDDELNLLKVISIEKMESHTNCINKVQWIDNDKFISSSDDKSIIVWQLSEV